MKTIRTTITNGVQTVFSVSFDLGYLSRDQVFVYTNNSVYTDQIGYRWVNDTQIETLEILPAGTSLHIRRVVKKNELVNDYTNNAILDEESLDKSFKQALMWLEEIQDGFVVPDGDDWTIFGNLQMRGYIDMNGFRILDLPEPVEPEEPIRLVDFERLLQITNSSVDRVVTFATDYLLDVSKPATHIFFMSDTDVTVRVPVAPYTTVTRKSINMYLTQLGDGQVRVVPEPTVSLRYPEDSLPVTYSKNATIAVESVEDHLWLVVGNMGY